MPAPPTRTGDRHGRRRPGLDALLGELAGEEYYAFDTEFHTERTYVPDLALIQIAWEDQVALVDPLAVDPAPLAAVFGGPGIAVAHAASQDLDVLMAACGAVPATVFDTQIVAGFLGMSTPSLARLVDQMLGVTLPKADRLSDWLVRPISDAPDHLRRERRRPPAGAADRARPSGCAPSAAWSGPSTSATRCWATAPRPASPRRPGGSWATSASMARRSRAVAQEVAAWRERTAADDQPATAHGALGPRPAGHLATAAP